MSREGCFGLAPIEPQIIEPLTKACAAKPMPLTAVSTRLAAAI